MEDQAVFWHNDNSVTGGHEYRGPIPTSEGVITDATLTGNGTVAEPLSVVQGGSGPTFADEEIPAGSVPGTSFTLEHVPNPAKSLQLVWNGTTLKSSGTDFTLTGNALETVLPVQDGDSFICWYRY